MHRGDPDHHHGPGGHSHPPRDALAGHNGPRPTSQWQTPHRALDPAEPARNSDSAADVDLVEASFIEGWRSASDATSFLRLAGVPFVAAGPEGRRLCLLRVEIEDLTDVGSVTPWVGGAGYRYDPLPTRFISRRRRLAFAYHDGNRLVRLDFTAARALAEFAETADPASPAR